MRVKPAPGLSVRDPATMQLLPTEGIEVPDGDILWTKLINDGDVVEITGAVVVGSVVIDPSVAGTHPLTDEAEKEGEAQ